MGRPQHVRQGDRPDGPFSRPPAIQSLPAVVWRLCQGNKRRVCDSGAPPRALYTHMERANDPTAAKPDYTTHTRTARPMRVRPWRWPCGVTIRWLRWIRAAQRCYTIADGPRGGGRSIRDYYYTRRRDDHAISTFSECSSKRSSSGAASSVHLPHSTADSRFRPAATTPRTRCAPSRPTLRPPPRRLQYR